MEITLDKKADAMYIKLRDGRFAKNRVIDEDTILDLNSKGKVLGIELLNVSKRISAKDLRGMGLKSPVRVIS